MIKEKYSPYHFEVVLKEMYSYDFYVVSKKCIPRNVFIYVLLIEKMNFTDVSSAWLGPGNVELRGVILLVTWTETGANKVSTCSLIIVKRFFRSI